jgi:hypothetical protein
MKILAALPGLALILLVLVDGFETVLLPRRITRRYRFVRSFYRIAWGTWRVLAVRIPSGKNRESFLSVFGPLALLGLFAFWSLGLIVGFGLVYWSLSLPFRMAEGDVTLPHYVYVSGTTFFTLGLGDVTPQSWPGRWLTVLEAGLGFGFLATVIGYLPVFYQAFSRRELTISLLDARAGSPPTAAQLLLRTAKARDALTSFMIEWERWAAEILEGHLSYPGLGFYRSQHDNQSWLAALTAILDTCALIIAAVKEVDRFQAQLTFAMARHVVVDLGLVIKVPPVAPDPDRLSAADYLRLRDLLLAGGVQLEDSPAVEAKLAELRNMYEPFANALARFFLVAMPPILGEARADNWQRSAWTKQTPGIGKLADPADEHFA